MGLPKPPGSIGTLSWLEFWVPWGSTLLTHPEVRNLQASFYSSLLSFMSPLPLWPGRDTPSPYPDVLLLGSQVLLFAELVRQPWTDKTDSETLFLVINDPLFILIYLLNQVPKGILYISDVKKNIPLPEAEEVQLDLWFACARFFCFFFPPFGLVLCFFLKCFPSGLEWWDRGCGDIGGGYKPSWSVSRCEKLLIPSWRALFHLHHEWWD